MILKLVFLETTTASFSADMAIGSTDGVSGEEAVTATYGFQIDLNTSFTGEDSLDISIDAGTKDAGTLDELDLNSSGDTLTVDGVSYTFHMIKQLFLLVTTWTEVLSTAQRVYGGPTNIR